MTLKSNATPRLAAKPVITFPAILHHLPTGALILVLDWESPHNVVVGSVDKFGITNTAAIGKRWPRIAAPDNYKLFDGSVTLSNS